MHSFKKTQVSVGCCWWAVLKGGGVGNATSGRWKAEGSHHAFVGSNASSCCTISVRSDFERPLRFSRQDFRRAHLIPPAVGHGLPRLVSKDNDVTKIQDKLPQSWQLQQVKGHSHPLHRCLCPRGPGRHLGLVVGLVSPHLVQACMAQKATQQHRCRRWTRVRRGLQNAAASMT